MRDTNQSPDEETVTDDHAAMCAVRDGRVELLGQLFETHHVHLYNFFLRQTRHREVSEDLVQETFVRILRSRHTYRNEGRFLTWLFSIARSALIDHYRSTGPRNAGEEAFASIPDTAPGPDTHVESADEIDLVRKALAELPTDRRELIELARFQNMSYRDIGALIGCTEGAVKVRMFRAMKELADQYTALAGGVPT